MPQARDVGLSSDWTAAAAAWAEANECVNELWLFGSRAKGTARADSDVDLGVVLTPPSGNGTDWALALAFEHKRSWRHELEEAIGVWHVSLELFGRPGEEEPDELVQIRTYAQCLWARL